MIVEVLQGQQHIPDNDAQRGWYDAESHFHRLRGNGGVNATAHAAGAAANEDRIAWVAALEDYLVATKQGSHRVGAQHLALFEIDNSMERERAGDAGDRVEFHRLDMAVLPQQLV